MYKIYAGLQNATFACIESFASPEEAWQYACDLACDEYDLEHSHDLHEMMDMGYNYRAALSIYETHREQVIDYWVETI
jgi:hypothetical protein